MKQWSAAFHPLGKNRPEKYNKTVLFDPFNVTNVMDALFISEPLYLTTFSFDSYKVRMNGIKGSFLARKSYFWATTFVKMEKFYLPERNSH